MLFIVFPIAIVVVTVIIILIAFFYDKKQKEKTYDIVDSCIVQEGSPVYYKDYRHIKVYLSRLGTQKVINRYLSQEGVYFETVARTLLDKELTILDKPVLVLKLEDFDYNKLTISYDMDRIDQDYLAILKALSVGETVQLKDVTKDVSFNIPSSSYILVNKSGI